ncbi:hypothetical protein OK351_01190 [Glutamicibacter sp. MNS18]|uniref:hypothetical protein n=1 Tax=Glutamicibacter sp. MNS18 TaxID=2989817 RepID=UPI002236B0EA|nr:hypothetical protein [Glutamicibacter sp. MNS18]MCW4464128.1 hypothetical protein [Glutamicibacter sp. MNS18]
MRIKVLISGLLAAAAVLLAAALDTPGIWVGVVTVLLQLVFAYTWPGFTGCEKPWPLRVILALAALASSAAAVGLGANPGLQDSLLVIAAGVLLVFVSQVFRGAAASGRLTNVVAGISGLALVSQGAGFSALGAVAGGFGIILVTVASLLGSGAVAMTRLPDQVVMVLSVLTGSAVAAAASALPLGLYWYHCLLIGALAGLLVGSMRAIVLATRAIRSTTHILAVSTLILLVAGALSWYAMQVMGRI